MTPTPEPILDLEGIKRRIDDGYTSLSVIRETQMYSDCTDLLAEVERLRELLKSEEELLQVVETQRLKFADELTACRAAVAEESKRADSLQAELSVVNALLGMARAERDLAKANEACVLPRLAEAENRAEHLSADLKEIRAAQKEDFDRADRAEAAARELRTFVQKSICDQTQMVAASDILDRTAWLEERTDG